MDVQTLIDSAGSPAKLGHKLGVARTTVLDWRKSGFIPGNRVAQISDVFRIPATDLLPLVQPPKPPAATEPAEASV